ncbi:MAG: hypothetical protein IT445_07320 [Phycisphaeraceae bacterium]|nr:hypothetical protein [Phycisphaeraceae bacterium]
MMRKHTLLGCTMLLAVLAWQNAAPAFEEAGAVPRGWQLDFTHDQPRTLAVTLPDGSVRWYWYMAYKVVNNTGEDRLFIPEIIIATDAGDILTAGQNVPAAVYPAVANKLNNSLLESPAQVVGKILQGPDYARESVAIWPAADHDVDELSIFIGGVSGETATVKNPITGEDVLVRRSRMITYATPGTVIKPEDQPVKLVAETDVMR